jgi:hypothetical protein
MQLKRLLLVLYLFVSLITLPSAPGTLHAQTFTGPELLARPTAHSVTVHIVNNSAIQAYIEYGTASGVYTGQTSTYSAGADEPIKVVISGLQPNTKYHYRMRYSTDAGTNWANRGEHTFYTQRAPGSTFTFTITSDSHVNILLGNASTWQGILTSVGNDHPDFHIDCGDTFAMDGNYTAPRSISTGIVTSAQAAREVYLFQRTSDYFGSISHSVPLFIAIGNHEEEERWHFSEGLSVWGANARKRYFPNPIPDGSFYSGNTDNTITAIDGDHLMEDYYAWQWGDALFVVIDPYWYTPTRPYSGGVGGGEGTAGSGNIWDWTLGTDQYNWLKNTLEKSNAKYKFLFMHHMTGSSELYIRGGAYAVPYGEWGGASFSTNRPGWYAPIHQVLIENNVSAVFHGHDHQYAYEIRDGIVYQSIPSAGYGPGFNYYSESNSLTKKVISSPGYLHVTVNPTQATVEYGSYSYTVDASVPQGLYGDVWLNDCDVDGSDLAAWIAFGASSGLDVAALAQNFGRTTCP